MRRLLHARNSRAVRVLARAAITAALVCALVPAFPAPALASTWTVDTVGRTDADIREMWIAMRPTYEGSAYTVTPCVVAPYAPGATAAGFVSDGLSIINFARYLAGLPFDVVTTSALNQQGQYGAVLLAASNFAHTPTQPADMADDFYAIGYASTSTSNIGSGYSTAEEFELSCLADSGPTNISRVGHRRWLLNPPMKQTGIGYASGRITTYALDTSRVEEVSFTKVAWPAEGLFPVEFFGSYHPWSLSLNPERYDWDTTGHTVTLRRIADGRTWTFTAADTNTSGEYFNADFGGYGVRDAFIFRPDPASVAYNPGDEFQVTLSGGIYAEGTKTPVTVTYRTQFMSVEGPVEWPDGVTVTEIAGATRVETAIEASQLAFPEGAATAVLATASNWPDALGGASLAGVLDAPILLTDPSTLSGPVTAELTRLGATKVVILGGTGAVSAAVERELETLLGSADSVDRIAGVDRYDTARKVAAETVSLLESAPEGYDGTAFVATGTNFPDALGASPLAAANGWPIYLVDSAGLSPATVSAMKAVGVTRAVVLGGAGAVPEDIENAIRTQVACSVERIEGDNRYQTAVGVAAFGVAEGGLSWSRPAIATGTSFPDALAGGVLQGKDGSVVLLTPSTTLDIAPKVALEAHAGDIVEVRFLGGAGAVSTNVRESVAFALW